MKKLYTSGVNMINSDIYILFLRVSVCVCVCVCVFVCLCVLLFYLNCSYSAKLLTAFTAITKYV